MAEVYAAVRQFVFVEGRSRWEVARVFGLSRETVAKICRFCSAVEHVAEFIDWGGRYDI